MSSNKKSHSKSIKLKENPQYFNKENLQTDKYFIHFKDTSKTKPPLHEKTNNFNNSNTNIRKIETNYQNNSLKNNIEDLSSINNKKKYEDIFKLKQKVQKILNNESLFDETINFKENKSINLFKIYKIISDNVKKIQKHKNKENSIDFFEIEKKLNQKKKKDVFSDKELSNNNKENLSILTKSERYSNKVTDEKKRHTKSCLVDVDIENDKNQSFFLKQMKENEKLNEYNKNSYLGILKKDHSFIESEINYMSFGKNIQKTQLNEFDNYNKLNITNKSISLVDSFKKTDNSFINNEKKDVSNNYNKNIIQIYTAELHEKDLEIIGLKNKVKKLELETRNSNILYQNEQENDKKDDLIVKLQTENNLKEKEIQYLKQFKIKLEGDLNDINLKKDLEKNKNNYIALIEKNKEISKLIEEIKIIKAENKILFHSEKDKYLSEIKEKEKIILEKDKLILELQEFKKKYTPFVENYSNIKIKINELEMTQENLFKENQNLKNINEKLKSESMENHLIVKEIYSSLEENINKLIEIKELGTGFFELAERFLEDEDINLEFLLNLRKKDNKLCNNDKNNNLINNIGILKQNIKIINEAFKKNFNRIYDLYAKKCGTECNIQ